VVVLGGRVDDAVHVGLFVHRASEQTSFGYAYQFRLARGGSVRPLQKLAHFTGLPRLLSGVGAAVAYLTWLTFWVLA
jgi:hypothetical protein